MRAFITTLLLIIAVSTLCNTIEQNDPERMIELREINNGLISFEMGNLGVLNNLVYQNVNKTLYGSSIWISGKKLRRDTLNRLLYWAQYPPNAETQILYEGHPDWTPDMVAVEDTLSTVGFDGDMDLYELLPAYNSLNIYNSNINNYDYYYAQDKLLESIAGEPAPLPFDPFNSDNYCFSIPQPVSFDTPGFQTYSSYYYDYCPFGSPGDRDWGNSHGQSTHYPLSLAIHQETYCWPVQDHDWMLVNKYDIYNTDPTDSIRDLAISNYTDADVGPVDWGTELAVDDVTGYVKGEGYEFAYSRDFDGDDGLSPYWIGIKVMIPEFSGNFDAWYWRVGNGPDDRDPRNLSPAVSINNQKYRLATGTNPDFSKYVRIRPQDPAVYHYEAPAPSDTRFLYTHFGAQPGSDLYDVTDDQGNYLWRLDLEPGESISCLSFIFIGTSLEDLKAKSLAIEAFLDDDLYIDPAANYTSIPFLKKPHPVEPNTFSLKWYSATNPDHYELAYKLYDAPAAEWNIIELPGTSHSYELAGMDPTSWYEIKVGAVFYTPQEVYLESETHLANITYTATEDPVQSPVLQLSNYPNPFKQHTNIAFDVKQAGFTELRIYNLKGQMVKELHAKNMTAGSYNTYWDGKDENGKSCASGLYYLRMNLGSKRQIKKMLMIK